MLDALGRCRHNVDRWRGWSNGLGQGFEWLRSSQNGVPALVLSAVAVIFICRRWLFEPIGVRRSPSRRVSMRRHASNRVWREMWVVGVHGPCSPTRTRGHGCSIFREYRSLHKVSWVHGTMMVSSWRRGRKHWKGSQLSSLHIGLLLDDRFCPHRCKLFVCIEIFCFRICRGRRVHGANHEGRPGSHSSRVGTMDRNGASCCIVWVWMVVIGRWVVLLCMWMKLFVVHALVGMAIVCLVWVREWWGNARIASTDAL